MNADLGCIDVCLPCYLTDHYNRPGELLLGVPVDGHTRNGQIKDALRNEFNSLADFGTPEDLEFEAALAACFAKCDGRKTFDKGLDVNGPNDWD